VHALTFEHVSKRYRADLPPALADVSFDIEEGARTCLLGPNGAGKSTAIRVLQGALRTTQGRVTLLGAAVDESAYVDARRRTGIVPQNPGMYTDLSALEYLELSHDLYGRGDIGSIVSLLGLEDQLRKPLAQLSGGFQRRVVLGSALLGDPDVLLLDEPTVGLDPIAAHDVHTFLRTAMQRPGRTTLLCTHNLDEAEALCDEVIILRDGRVLVHSPLSELRRSAQPRVRLEALQGPEILEAALRERGLDVTRALEDDAVLVLLEQPERDAPDLLRALLGKGIDVYSCQTERATLNELFQELVRGS
jgi:ABC-2 type transport system ATP-binding protein